MIRMRDKRYTESWNNEKLRVATRVDTKRIEGSYKHEVIWRELESAVCGKVAGLLLL